LGFFEVIIWLLTVGQIMQHLDNVLAYIAYGGGFATGNYIGMVIEEKLSIGTVIIRIVPRNNTSELIAYLRERNYGVTSVHAQGSRGEVDIVFTIVKRKSIDEVVGIINQFNPNAFYTIEDVRSINEGIITRTRRKSVLNGFWFSNKKIK
jgi:uncharacterized protein YebE (UPF0316 family)